MATEAQRLIGISLAKIAQSRCGRGGVSLHKNLLVATVLQKARFIFMEEAYHMVHGHYLQANKFLEPDIDIQDDPNDSVSSNDSIDECELDDIFDAPASSIGKDSDSSEDFSEELCDKENSPPETSSNIGLVYLDLDKHLQKASQVASENNTTGNNKRRREISEWETEEAVLSILPKKIKSDAVVDSSSSSSSGSDSDSDSIYGPDDDIFLSDRISSSHSSSTNNNNNNDDDNTAAINLSVNVSRELELDELNNNISNNNNNNNLVSNHNNNNTSSNTDNNTISNTNLENGPSMEGIDRITSLVSIFSFGNLTRSVSTPDLCSAQATKDSCSNESSLSQRTYLAMTV